MTKSFFNKNSPRDKKTMYQNCEQVMTKKVLLPPPLHENNMSYFFIKMKPTRITITMTSFAAIIIYQL